MSRDNVLSVSHSQSCRGSRLHRSMCPCRFYMTTSCLVILLWERHLYDLRDPSSYRNSISSRNVRTRKCRPDFRGKSDPSRPSHKEPRPHKAGDLMQIRGHKLKIQLCFAARSCRTHKRQNSTNTTKRIMGLLSWLWGSKSSGETPADPKKNQYRALAVSEVRPRCRILCHCDLAGIAQPAQPFTPVVFAGFRVHPENRLYW
jgi:hypothetical protein